VEHPEANTFTIYLIKLIIYVSTTILLTHKATCFDPSVGHLKAYVAD